MSKRVGGEGMLTNYVFISSFKKPVKVNAYLKGGGPDVSIPSREKRSVQID